jgi:hypothetical protein
MESAQRRDAAGRGREELVATFTSRRRIVEESLARGLVAFPDLDRDFIDDALAAIVVRELEHLETIVRFRESCGAPHHPRKRVIASIETTYDTAVMREPPPPLVTWANANV